MSKFVFMNTLQEDISQAIKDVLSLTPLEKTAIKKVLSPEKVALRPHYSNSTSFMQFESDLQFQLDYPKGIKSPRLLR